MLSGLRAPASSPPTPNRPTGLAPRPTPRLLGRHPLCPAAPRRRPPSHRPALLRCSCGGRSGGGTSGAGGTGCGGGAGRGAGRGARHHVVCDGGVVIKATIIEAPLVH